jgi:hypothetical protein
MPPNKIRTLGAESDGKMLFHIDRLTIPQNRLIIFLSASYEVGLPIDEVMTAAEKAEGFGEAARLRPEFGCRAEMPFANPAGGVSGVF